MTFVDSLQNAVIWYLAISAIALLTYPLTYAICRGLPDRGVSLYRPLGMIVSTLPLWWVGNLMNAPFTGTVFLLVAVTIGVIAWCYAILRSNLLSNVRELRRRWLVIEIATALLFFGYVVIRGFNPDIQGTEKPMELAFLSASIHSNSLPVTDPWFAGEPINYYYYGYAVLGLFAKVAGLKGGVVFTLGLATTFAMAAIAAGGLAANLAARISDAPRWALPASGVLGGLLLMFAGNLHAPVELARSPSETMSAGWWDGIGWSSSRIIEDTGFPGEGTTRTVISEFPAFSWILGDLHPHLLAYPWLIAAIALVANYYYLATRPDPGRTSLAGAVGIGVLLGVLYSANTWDVAIVGLLSALAILLAFPLAGWRKMASSAAQITVTAVATAFPFARQYTTAAGATDEPDSRVLGMIPMVDRLSATVGYVNWDRTSTGELLLAHGGFLILTVVVVAGGWRYTGGLSRQSLLYAGSACGALLLASLLLRTPALALFGIPLIALVLAALRNRQVAEQRFPLMLLAAAFGVLIVLEFFYIRDPFGDRMNTIFKVYFALWAVFSVVLAALLPAAFRHLTAASSRVIPTLAFGVTAFVLLAMSVYSPLSAYRWYSEFDNWTGIDGAAYLERVQPGEAAAINWLREHAEANDVLLEAPGCSYGQDNRVPHSRMSMATGIPTVIGWDGHQFQWRRQQPDLLPEIGARVEHTRLIYERPASDEAAAWLDGYEVTFVVVGAHETEGYVRCEHGPPYDSVGLSDLDKSDLDLVFEDQGVRIFAPRDEDLVN